MNFQINSFLKYCFNNIVSNLIVLAILTISLLVLSITFYPKSYSSSILIAGAEQEGDASVESSGLSGLASLAGIEVGGGKQAQRALINLEYLKSRTFLGYFFIEKEYLKLLVPKFWDQDKNELVDEMSLTELHGYIYEKHLGFSEDRRKKTITLTVKSHDPLLSSDIANNFIKLGNDVIRKRTIEENKLFFKALTENSQSIDSITLRQGISSKVLTKLFNNAIAESKDDYAFDIIDKAHPNPRQIPSKFILAVLSGCISFLILFCFRLYTFRIYKE